MQVLINIVHLYLNLCADENIAHILYKTFGYILQIFRENKIAVFMNTSYTYFFKCYTNVVRILTEIEQIL